MSEERSTYDRAASQIAAYVHWYIEAYAHKYIHISMYGYIYKGISIQRHMDT